SNEVVSSANYVAPANISALRGSGDADIVLTGGAQPITITGNAGNDTLVAGTGDAMLVAGSGVATLIGGSGSNTFKINESGDVVIAQAGAAQNTILTTVSFVAPANVQSLTATGAASV